MPIFRHTSATATPVSACFNANTICDSVNFDLFMAIMSFPASHNCPAFFYFILALFLGRRSAVNVYMAAEIELHTAVHKSIIDKLNEVVVSSLKGAITISTNHVDLFYARFL